MAEILMPYAESVGSVAWRGAPRLSTVDGRTIGIVNNSWRCMDVVAAELSELLTGEHGVSGIREEKISAAQVLPPDRLAEMARRCDAVVVGIGN
jgi:hypothetical protein